FITLVNLGVIGYAAWHYKGGAIRKWAGADKGKTAPEQVSSTDFDELKNAPGDPGRDVGSTGVTNAALGSSGTLGRTLVVGINTWVGHSPRILYKHRMYPHPPAP